MRGRFHHASFAMASSPARPKEVRMNPVRAPQRRPAACSGAITTGTLLVAALSALVLMTGCHSATMHGAPTHTASVAAAHDPSDAESMPHLAPFDEQFGAAGADDTEASQN